MTMTRDEKSEAVKHICRNVLCQPDDSSIEKALRNQGFEDPHSIVNMTEEEICSLSFREIIKTEGEKDSVLWIDVLPGHRGSV